MSSKTSASIPCKSFSTNSLTPIPRSVASILTARTSARNSPVSSVRPKPFHHACTKSCYSLNPRRRTKTTIKCQPSLSNDYQASASLNSIPSPSLSYSGSPAPTTWRNSMNLVGTRSTASQIRLKIWERGGTRPYRVNGSKTPNQIREIRSPSDERRIKVTGRLPFSALNSKIKIQNSKILSIHSALSSPATSSCPNTRPKRWPSGSFTPTPSNSATSQPTSASNHLFDAAANRPCSMFFHDWSIAHSSRPTSALRHSTAPSRNSGPHS